MTLLEAAEQVLRHSRRPLTATEITAIALKRGLLHTKGRTPAASMRAALYAAPEGSPIERKFEPGRKRAARGSVRWFYQAKS
jgi:hypothetical protein